MLRWPDEQARQNLLLLNMKPVLITTDKRGVFFGYLADDDATKNLPESIVLKNARNCIYWSAETKGFLGLAKNGPADGSRIGPAADELTLYGITSLAEVSDDAVKRWEAAPWKD